MLQVKLILCFLSPTQQRWHEDYSLFRKVSVYLLTGLELYQNRK